MTLYSYPLSTFLYFPWCLGPIITCLTLNIVISWKFPQLPIHCIGCPGSQTSADIELEFAIQFGHCFGSLLKFSPPCIFFVLCWLQSFIRSFPPLFFFLSCCWYCGILELNQLKLGHFYLIPGSQTVPRNDLARHKSMELNAGVISVCSISLRSHFSIYFLGNWRSQANISSWTVLQLHYLQWNIAFSHADL